MKEIMLAIKPVWAEKILLKEKTLEIRKRRPADDGPFKVYIYVTQAKPGWVRMDNVQLSGRVVGEFICDKIYRIDVPYPAYQKELPQWVMDQSCLSYYQLHRYALASNDCPLYGWHIAELVEYKEPIGIDCFLSTSKIGVMRRPPQSWQYVIRKG